MQKELYLCGIFLVGFGLAVAFPKAPRHYEIQTSIDSETTEQDPVGEAMVRYCREQGYQEYIVKIIEIEQGKSVKVKIQPILNDENVQGKNRDQAKELEGTEELVIEQATIIAVRVGNQLQVVMGMPDYQSILKDKYYRVFIQDQTIMVIIEQQITT